MIILGISSGFHDAAVTVLDDSKILFAAHSERYSKKKNDPWLNQDIINEALHYGKPDVIVLHEHSGYKKLRHLISGDLNSFREPSQAEWIQKFYPQLAGIPVKQYWHHETHAAAGILTCGYQEAAVMVIDAIGEFDTASIWHWKDNSLIKKHSVKYPSSLGLFYTAITQRVGLKPMEDEYILMGMAAYGNRKVYAPLSRQMGKDFFKHAWPWQDPKQAVSMRKNTHRGISKDVYAEYKDFDIAAAAQEQLEERVLSYASYAKQLTGSNNLVFMGGVALNCVVNTRLYELGYKYIHIMPNPGDAGSSLGAAALEYFKQTGKRVRWSGPYLGTNIPGAYPVKAALASLEERDIFGIANGRAEFGPRSLGNRSLMADPRGSRTKDRVNRIKQRQKFRPFAPVILEEHLTDYFDVPTYLNSSPYMQFVAKCKRPDEFPAIVHADGTSRVQTVNQQQHPGLYALLSEFHRRTGCPMLLNTSLNVKGKPIVNDMTDAALFARQYGVKVHISD
jgi:carbamoyltransferase